MAANPTDAIALLVKDHKEVKQLFADYERLSDRSSVGKKKLAQNICAALTVHAEIEEEIFYPAVRRAIDDDDLMDEALVEHSGAKELIAQIESANPGDDQYDAMIKVLCEQITHHVKEEEGEMFPQVRKAKLDLHALGDAMSARKRELESGRAQPVRGQRQDPNEAAARDA